MEVCLIGFMGRTKQKIGSQKSEIANLLDEGWQQTKEDGGKWEKEGAPYYFSFNEDGYEWEINPNEC